MLLLSGASLTHYAQSNLTQAEYFFDSDPGVGAATAVTAFGAATTIDINEMIDVSSLSVGMHTLGIRVMDDNLIWSMTEYVPVFVTLASAMVVSNITEAEYFFGADPGLGLGTAISVSTSQSIDITDMLSTAALSFGMHTLSIRIKNEFDEWSIAETVPVFVTASSALVISDIDQAEYFFDSDPGIGAGTPITLTATPNLDINELISTAALSIGMHTFNIRIRTAAGEWSIPETIPVFVDQNNQITQFEYFYDTDPGSGAGTNVPIAPPTNSLDANFDLSTASLGLGSHTLGIRLAGANNIWGITEYITFTICDGAIADFSAITTCVGDVTNFSDLSMNVLGGDTYSWDFDGDLTEDDNTVGSTSFTYPSTGSYMATLTVDRAGCASTQTVQVDVVDPPTANAGSNFAICEGDVANLTAIIGGSATGGTWTTSGTGTFDDPNLLTPTYTPAGGETGTITMTFTSTAAGTCVAAVSNVDVTIDPVATATAGVDQTICESDVVNLSGLIGGSATTSSWSTSGDGTFDDNTILNAVYTPGTADISSGTITLTLTTDDPAGACVAASSQLTITIDNAATANAGSDFFICTSDVALLNGSISGLATTSSWSTSGDGSFDNAASLNATYTPGAADVSAGSVLLTLTTDDPPGTCVAGVSTITVSISNEASATAGPDQSVCETDLVILAGALGGSSTIGTWTTGGDGSFDDVNNLAATYTPGAGDISGGTVTLTLTPNDPLSCGTITTDQVVITLDAAAIADAGTNQSICPGDPVNLSGTATGLSSVWTTTGTGTFDDATNLNAIYTPSAADQSAGTFDLTLSVTASGACPVATSAITVNVGQPVDIIQQNISLEVQQTVNVLVTSGGSFGANDVLTTSILQTPAKGTATILNDGTIDYVATQGNIGADSFEFEVCNQCGICDQDFVIVDILNSAPTISTQPVTAPPRNMVSIDLNPAIFDLNDNVDFSTLTVLVQPASGASASIDASNNLTVDYTNVFFTGQDQLTLEVCDFSGACASAIVDILITETDIIVYNAVSPNGDGAHDFLEVVNIEFFPNNSIQIFNRWGDVVYATEGYDNLNTIFTGIANKGSSGELPTGTYYYSIDLNNSSEVKSGFFMLSR